jgi:hypothetical protein
VAQVDDGIASRSDLSLSQNDGGRPSNELHRRPQLGQCRRELPVDLQSLPVLDFNADDLNDEMAQVEGCSESTKVRIVNVKVQRPMYCKRSGSK